MYSVSFLGREFRFVRCLACGLVYQNPLLDRESRNHIYETTEYWEHKKVESQDQAMLNYYSYLEEASNRRQTNKIRMEKVISLMPAGSRILDLGCADGLYVHMLSEAGYRAYGMDISSNMVSVAHKNYNGINVVQGDVEKDWSYNEPFDAIVCYTVSNFVSAARVFTQIRRYLRPGGCFFFNFADHSRFLSRVLCKRYYLYRPTAAILYSKKCFSEYCEKYDLHIEEMENDVQMVPLARTCGMLFRTQLVFNCLKLLGLEETCVKMPLFTQYAGYAVRK